MAKDEVEFEVWVDEGPDEVEVVPEVVETVASSTLSLPEWVEAVRLLEKKGLLEKGESFGNARTALFNFQNTVGITGIEQGTPTEETLALLAE
jgi:hypothetical protein